MITPNNKFFFYQEKTVKAWDTSVYNKNLNLNFVSQLRQFIFIHYKNSTKNNISQNEFQSFSFRMKTFKLFTVLAALLSLLFFFFFFLCFLCSQSSIVWTSYLFGKHGTSTTVNEKLYFCNKLDSGKLFDLIIFWLIWFSVGIISTALCLFNLKNQTNSHI